MIVREYYQRGAPDPVLDQDHVLGLVRRHIGKAAAVTGVDETGGEARVYVVDDRVILKVQRPQQLRSWTSLEKEVVFLRRIAADAPDLPVPRVLGYGRDGSVEYTCMTRMPGDAAVRTPIAADERPLALRAVGRVLRRIHGINQAELRASGLFPEEWTAADLRQSVAQRVEDVSRRLEADGIAWPLSLPVAQVVAAAQAQVPASPPAVALHTNPGPTHTFVDPVSGRFLGLIDFGDAYIGHPAFDLWQWGDPADRDWVAAGYTEEGALPDEFWRFWTVVQALSDLTAIARQRPYAPLAAGHLAELVRRW